MGSVSFTHLGRYELLQELASGGMGSVHAARVVGVGGFERIVAIKLCHPHLRDDTDFAGMFLDEARLIANLRHPNVVATLDVGDDPLGGLYIVMEFVDGVPLYGLWRAAQHRHEAIPVGVALRIMIDTLRGLHAAHDHTDPRGEPLHIVHRDVSPQNVLVGVDGISKIMDFGIARATSRIASTREGQLKGKFAYLAPEQHGILTEGGHTEVTRRTDLFAAGAVLWELLAGERLFHRDTDAATIGAAVRCEIPLLKDRVEGVTPALDMVLQKGMAREPTSRYPTGQAFADALEDCGVAVASSREVATWINQLVGHALETRQAKLRARIAQPPVFPKPTTPRPTLLPPPDREDPSEELIEERRPPQQRQAVALGVGVFLVVALFIGTALRSTSTAVARTNATPEPTRSEPRVEPPAPTPAVAEDAGVAPALAPEPVDAGPSVSVEAGIANHGGSHSRPTRNNPSRPYRPRFL